MKLYLFFLVFFIMLSCKVADKSSAIGSIERTDPAIDDVIEASAAMEILAEGYEWSEGPVWVEEHKMLLFSDVPKNTVYKWTESGGAEVYLSPSGYTGSQSPYSKEEGSNGLALNGEGKLVLCQHGDRRLAVMESAVNEPQAKFATLADTWDGKRFNSPNDVAIRGNGDYFFTDPPYGLPENAVKEIPFQGVYKVSNGTATLLVDSLTRPNGIAFTPDERAIIVANSDPEKAVWYRYEITENDSLINGKIFFDATAETKSAKGLPDGLKIDSKGNVFATGPGGVWIFDASGKVLGRIQIPEATANCALSPDEKTLYITADMYLIRLRMRE